MYREKKNLHKIKAALRCSRKSQDRIVLYIGDQTSDRMLLEVELTAAQFGMCQGL